MDMSSAASTSPGPAGAPAAGRLDDSPPSAASSSPVQEKAQEVAGQAQEQAREAAGRAKGQLRAQVDERSTQAGDRVSTTASDIRSVAEQLRSDGKDQPAKLAEQAADRAERLGGYLKDSDADRILADVEDFARRQPMAVVLGGLAAGFAASRLLKASSRRRADEDRSPGAYGSSPRSDLGGLPPVGGTSAPVTAPPPPAPGATTPAPAQSLPPAGGGDFR